MVCIEVLNDNIKVSLGYLINLYGSVHISLFELVGEHGVEVFRPLPQDDRVALDVLIFYFKNSIVELIEQSEEVHVGEGICLGFVLLVFRGEDLFGFAHLD